MMYDGRPEDPWEVAYKKLQKTFTSTVSPSSRSWEFNPWKTSTGWSCWSPCRGWFTSSKHLYKDSFTSYFTSYSHPFFGWWNLPQYLRAKWQLHWSRRSTRAAAVPKNIPEPPRRCWCPSLCNTCLGVVWRGQQGAGFPEVVASCNLGRRIGEWLRIKALRSCPLPTPRWISRETANYLETSWP